MAYAHLSASLYARKKDEVILMESDELNIQEVLEFLSKGGLKSKELSLETLAPEDLNKIIVKPKSLAPGLANGPLVLYREWDYSVSPPVTKPIVFCESCRDLDLFILDYIGGIITIVGDLTSHIVVRANALSIPVVRVDAAQAEAMSRFIGTPCITLAAGCDDAAVFIGNVHFEFRDDWDGFARMARATRAFRALEVKANIDDHNDARKAIEAGADGSGMWRTENYLAKFERGQLLQTAILEALGGKSIEQANGIRELLEIMLAELNLILDQLQESPLVVRLLDFSLADMLKATGYSALPRSSQILISEANPLFSIRGARLGIVYPVIAEFQLRAIIMAVARANEIGKNTNIAIQVPFVVHVSEMNWYRSLFFHLASDLLLPTDNELYDKLKAVKFGATIETPRAAITAAELARSSDFFCFGTNDLTQYTWAIDRDSGYVEITAPYLKKGILNESPFCSLDRSGVGKLIEYAISSGRGVNPDLKIGGTGIFGNQLDMIGYFCRLGFNYISVSIPHLPFVALGYTQHLFKETSE
jgi:pyruvate,orthophosphate dikinase